MADVIKPNDIDRLVLRATKLAGEGKYSAIQIIKKVIDVENFSLSEAKEAYLLAANNETLSEYQGQVFLPLFKELEESFKEK